MKPIKAPIQVPMWELACLHGITRDDLHKALGPPHFTESDSSRTFGGEEDWWGLELDSGHQVALCLRVPYGDAVLLADTKNSSIPLTAFSAAACLGTAEIYEHPASA